MPPLETARPLPFDRLPDFLAAVEEALRAPDGESCQAIVFRKLVAASEARSAVLFLLDLYDELRVVANQGILGDPPAALPESLASQFESRLAESNEPAFLGAADPWASVRTSPPWAGEALWVPIHGRTRPLGGIYLEGFPPAVGSEQIRYLAALGLHLGACLETLFVHREHEKKKQRIDKLNRVLEKQIETQTLRIKRLASELQSSKREIQLKYNYDRIVGKSSRMQEIFAILDKVIDSDLPVLIQGESGTGKELIAKAIHYNGKRKDGSFVSENCAAIGESLFESELFGYERGAFTGADESKPGLFEVASGGTLFLDEIGDLSPENQKKILRALQEGEIRRVGGKAAIPVDVRIISATNRHLEALIDEGGFREDLYYRLKGVTIRLPPLRERVEDIGLLVDHFLAEIAKERSGVPKSLSPEALCAFMNYPWPGNIRELENEVHRLVIMGEKDFRPGATTSVRRFQGSGVSIPPGLGLEQAVHLFETGLVKAALEEARWNKSQAAKSLKIGRMKLHRKMEKLGLVPPAELEH